MSIRDLQNLVNQAMNEATYYGKNSKLVEGEKIIERMQDIFTGDGKMSSQNAKTLDTKRFQEQVIKLENLFKELFGFDKVFINRIFETRQAGAYTTARFSVQSQAQTAQGKYNTKQYKVDSNHKAVKLNPKDKIICYIYIDPALFFKWKNKPDETMTAAEIMAVILHEIGHSLYNNNIRSQASQWTMILNNPAAAPMMLVMLLVQYLMTDAGYEQADRDGIALSRSNASMKREQVLDPYRELGTVEKAFVIAGEFTNHLLLPVFVLMALFMNIGAFISGHLGYDAEKYSDAVATSFGYGTELASALMKFKTYGGHWKKETYILDRADKNGKFNLYQYLRACVMLPLNMIIEGLMPHPSNLGRLNNNIKYLEESIEANIDNPRLRKEALDDLKKAQSYREKIMETYKNADNLDDRARYGLMKTLAKLGITDLKDWTTEFRKHGDYDNLDFKD